MADTPLTAGEIEAMGLSPADARAPYGQGYTPPPRPGRRAPHNPAADRVRALAEQQRAQRQAMHDSLQSKIVYANAIGRPDESLIPMSELAKAGLSAERTAQGLPYGIDPKSLSADERAYLGLPPVQPPQQAMIQELMRRRASAQAPVGALASLTGGQ
jgi:hypothetical protein